MFTVLEIQKELWHPKVARKVSGNGPQAAALTMPLVIGSEKTRQKHAFFGTITNQKLRLIYSKLTCEPKTKDCAGSGSVQRLNCDCIVSVFEIPRVS